MNIHLAESKRGNEQFKRLVLFAFSVLIIAAETYAFWICWIHYYNPRLYSSFFYKGHLVMILVYVLLTFAMSKVYGAFKIGYLRTTDILFSQTLSMLFVNVVVYLQTCMLSLRLVSVWPMLILTVVDFIIIVIWTFLTKYVYAKLYPPRKMLLVYCDRDPDGLVKKMNKRKDRYNICGSVHIDKGMEYIADLIEDEDFEAVLLCDIPGDIRNDLIKYCFARSIRVYLTPKISDVIIEGGDNMHLFDTPLILMRNRGFSIEHKVVKRIMDIIVSLIVLVIFSPILLIVAIAIKLTDGGTIFYKQERLTYNEKVFMLYKFRSMRMDSEKNGARLSFKHDDRVTPIGKIIRKIHVDELPQLINILKGEMSFVGPRPERPEIAEQYYKEIPEFRYRLKVKAGLTGYAQIYGKYNTTPYDKLKLDMYYIEHCTVLMDLRLILMTVKILFQKDSTEGVEKEQTTAVLKHKKVKEYQIHKDD